MKEMQAPERRIPPWVAILLVALFVGGAGWFVWKALSGDSKKGDEQTYKLDPNAPRSVVPSGRRGAPGRTFTPPPRDNTARVFWGGDGVARFGSSWRISAGNARASIDNGQPSFGYRWSRVLSQDQIHLLEVRRAVVNFPAAATELKVSEEQLTRLRAMGEGGMVVGDAERQQFLELWKTWEAAANNASARRTAEDALVAALRAMGDKHLEETKQYYAKRVEQAKSIFTAEQNKQLLGLDPDKWR